MSNDDRRPQVAGLALAAGIGLGIGYGAYKFFELLKGNANEEQPHMTDNQRSIGYQRRVPSAIKEIRVVNTVSECQRAMIEIKAHCREYNVLGFDCEWNNPFNRQSVALLQFTTHRGLCVLIRLCKLPQIPSELREILEDSNILKVGVASRNDAIYLYEDYRIRTKSTFDLQYMAYFAECNPGKLSKMSEDYLDIKLNKESATHSGWEDDVLSANQKEYAAKDAYVGIELFKYFAEEIKPAASFESKKSHVQFIIQKYHQFFDIPYNGSQGVPEDFINDLLSSN